MMSLSEYVFSHQPISNIPSLLDLHHNNPLGVHPLVPLCVMLLLAIAIHVVNHRIRHQGADNLYPYLYALLGADVLVSLYYCFMGDLPLFYDRDVDAKEICVGWFCQHDNVGYFWSIVGVLLLTYTVWIISNALMQTVARLSADAGLTQEKYWKEWRLVLSILLVGATAAAIADSFDPIVGTWILLCLEVVLTLCIITKTVADCIRCHNVWRGLLIGVAAFLTFLVITMLTLEAIEGYVYVILFIILILSSTKAQTKKQ